MELFKHKEKILCLTQLSEIKILQAYHALIKQLHLYKEVLMTGSCDINHV